MSRRTLLAGTTGGWVAFVVGVGLGYCVIPVGPIKATTMQLGAMSIGNDFGTILLANLGICLLILVLGVCTLGVAGFLVLLFNGMSVGAQIHTAIVQGHSWPLVLLLLMPHGVIEITSMGIVAAAAASVSTYACRSIFFPRPEMLGFSVCLSRSIRYLAFGGGLLVFAAGVESVLTPLVVLLALRGGLT